MFLKSHCCNNVKNKSSLKGGVALLCYCLNIIKTNLYEALVHGSIYQQEVILFRGFNQMEWDYQIFMHDFFTLRKGRIQCFFIKMKLNHKIIISKASFLVFFYFFMLRICFVGCSVQAPEINAIKAVANYFSVTCMYFIMNSTTDISTHRLAKRVFLEVNSSVALSNFSAYRNMLEEVGEGQCQIPLRVILQLHESKLAKEFEDFNGLYKNHHDKICSGAWLVFMESFEDEFVADFFRKIYLPMDVEVLVAWIHNDTVHLKEVYQISPSHAVKQPYFGIWSTKTGLSASRSQSLYLRRMDLEGLQLKVGYIEGNLPFTTTSPNNTEDKTLMGYFGEVWQILENFMNFSSVYVKVDLSLGKEEDNNSWLRIMKMLKEKKIDVGLADFVASTARIDSLDFSYPLLVSNFQVFYKSDPSEGPSRGYLLPFGKDIWLTLFIWSVFHSLCISCFTWIHKRFTCTGRNFTGPASYFMTFRGLCGQSSPNTPKLPSCRLLFLMTYIVATVVIPSYSAFLTHYLTSKTSGTILKDLTEVSQTRFHKIVVVEGSYEYYIINLNKDNKNLMKIFEKHKNNLEISKSYKESISLACKEKSTAIFTMASTLTWELNKAENRELKEKCSLEKMTQHGGTILNGILFPKDTRYRELIDHHLRNLKKTGVTERLQQKYWTIYRDIRKKFWESGSLQNSSTIFEIILCGTILSSVVVLLERSIYQSMLRKSKKKRLRRYLFFLIKKYH